MQIITILCKGGVKNKLKHALTQCTMASYCNKRDLIRWTVCDIQTIIKTYFNGRLQKTKTGVQHLKIV